MVLEVLRSRGIIRRGEVTVGGKTRPVWHAGSGQPGGASQDSDEPELPF